MNDATSNQPYRMESRYDLHDEFSNSRLFCEARMERRAIDEMLGLAAGITSDGDVNQKEAEFLHDWIANNAKHLDDPVVNLLYRRLNDMLADGILDEEESSDLLSLLLTLNSHPTPAVANDKPQPVVKLSSTLPLNDPVPDIEFEGKTFVLTGVMAYGPRAACKEVITDRGGIIGGTISKNIDYLVVGTIANEQWKHSSYGTKMVKAMECREKYGRLAIISEESWQKAAFE